jgi:hypothetical protein
VQQTNFTQGREITMMNTPDTDTAAIQTAQQDITSAEVASTPSTQENSAHAELQRTFFLSECTILHDEINARMAQRGNLFTFTIITAGSLLSLGATTNPRIALFYPVLSLFLAAAWSDEDGKIGALGAYLHDQEARYDLDGWSSYHRMRKQKTRLWLGGLQRFVPRSLLGLATRGIFLSTQVLAILVALSQIDKDHPWDIILLLCIAIAATLATAFIIQHKRNHTLEREQRDS